MSAANMQAIKAAETRFWSKVQVGDADICWNWTATVVRQYGAIYIAGKPRRANRVALSLKLGRVIKPEEFACHTCDNPLCCNPDHLFVGTNHDNIVDMCRKGRQYNQVKTHCVHGHSLEDPANLIARRLPHRACKTCHSQQRNASRIKRKAARRAAATA